MIQDADYALPMWVRAEMARAGLHDLMPYWSPDTDSIIDPLDDPETRAAVRSFIGKVWRASAQIGLAMGGSR